MGLKLEDNLPNWRVCPKKKRKKKHSFFFVNVVHSYWSELGSLWREYLVHHNWFLENFCATLLTSNPLGLGTKSETYNVLALKYLSCVELNIVMIITQASNEVNISRKPPLFWVCFQFTIIVENDIFDYF